MNILTLLPMVGRTIRNGLMLLGIDLRVWIMLLTVASNAQTISNA